MKDFIDYGIVLPAGAEGQLYLQCPQCSTHRKKKSAKPLAVNTHDGVWYCHHCGWKGSLKTGTEIKSNPNYWAEIKRKPIKIKTDGTITDKLERYFERRGISRDTLEIEGVVEERIYMPQIEDFTEAIVFPYIKEDNLVNIKYRDYKKNMRQSVGGEQCLWRYDLLHEFDEIIITEGEIDALSLIECGFNNVTSVPNGAPSVNTNNYEAKFQYLETAKDIFDKVKKVILVVDKDLPGIKLEEELARRIGKEKCWVVDYPANCKDINDVLVKHGKDAVVKLIGNAKEYPVEGIFTSEDFKKQLQGLYVSGVVKGLHPGWDNLSNLYTVRQGELTVFTGIPGHGKSEFMDALIINMIRKHQWRWAIYSPENYPPEFHLSKLAEKWGGKSFFHGTVRLSEDELKEFVEEINNYLYFIIPDDGENTLDDILEKMRATVFRYGVRGCLIDPWNEIEHSRPSNMTETEYISAALSKIRRFSRMHGVHSWIIAHPTKLMKDKDGNYPVPTPYDISGSANWRNKADNCLAIYRHFNDNDNIVELHVQKIRFKQVGRLGVAKFQWNKISGRFYGKGYKVAGE